AGRRRLRRALLGSNVGRAGGHEQEGQQTGTEKRIHGSLTAASLHGLSGAEPLTKSDQTLVSADSSSRHCNAAERHERFTRIASVVRRGERSSFCGAVNAAGKPPCTAWYDAREQWLIIPGSSGPRRPGIRRS